MAEDPISRVTRHLSPRLTLLRGLDQHLPLTGDPRRASTVDPGMPNKAVASAITWGSS